MRLTAAAAGTIQQLNTGMLMQGIHFVEMISADRVSIARKTIVKK